MHLFSKVIFILVFLFKLGLEKIIHLIDYLFIKLFYDKKNSPKMTYNM